MPFGKISRRRENSHEVDAGRRKPGHLKIAAMNKVAEAAVDFNFGGMHLGIRRRADSAGAEPGL